MPLRKVKGGWMWGSKGPFPTQAKALAVARAAYASGYKEDADVPKKQQVFPTWVQESKKQA